MSRDRRYKKSHPWLTFSFDSGHLDPETWILLGEASSKIQHLARATLVPEIAEQLLKIYLTKGVHATTKIEGNTLTLEEVSARLKSRTLRTVSRGYLVQEVDNVLDALHETMALAQEKRRPWLTTEDVRGFNRGVLRGLSVADHVQPGEFRLVDVGVMNYLGPHPEDVEYLTDKMCQWINNLRSNDSSFVFVNALLRAILAHLYIAWIHPFGDGNGRTARLVEWKLLLTSGVPQPATHLLSNFYCRTREEYYSELDRASQTKTPVHFIKYAVRGFVEEIKEQLDAVWRQQDDLVWFAYLHRILPESGDIGNNRRRHLLVDLSQSGVVTAATALRIPEILRLDLPRIHLDYAKVSDRTLRRDIESLVEIGLLLTTTSGKVFVNRDLIRAFRPTAIDPTLPNLDTF